MTRVLVTGAGGFVGGAVLRRRPAAVEVVALSRQAASFAGTDAGPGDGSVAWLRWDPLGDEPRPAALDDPFDAVIHLAGNADHGLAVRDPAADLAATATLAVRLLPALRTRSIVVLSSAAVYAGLVGSVDPTAPVQPAMAYALSKRYVEGLAQALQADRGVARAVVIRLYNAFGPGERPTRLIPRVVAAARDRSTFRLTSALGSLADPVHVDEVARVLWAAAIPRDAFSPTAGGSFRTYDLAGGDPRPIEQQVGRIAEVLGLQPPDVVHEPDPTQVPIRFWSSPDRLVDEFALDAIEPFDEGLRRYGRTEGWISS